MSIHTKVVCQFDRIHAQCRCPAPDKTVTRVDCDQPENHDPEHKNNASHR